MQGHPAGRDELAPETRAFYRDALEIVKGANVPFLVGGAYAFGYYTGIVRHTKDFDLFIRRRDCARALEAFAAAGCRAELTFPHWLGKAYRGEDFIDLIFASGNGVARVDDTWFEHACAGEVLDEPVQVCPAEEILLTKAFILERERCDAADVAHLLRARARMLDWPYLLRRFGAHWRVLLSHLVFFGFIYPAERALIPAEILEDLLSRLKAELKSEPPVERVCMGTLLSRAQYLMDTQEWGYQDGRLQPRGGMRAEEIEQWTAAIEGGK